MYTGEALRRMSPPAPEDAVAVTSARTPRDAGNGEGCGDRSNSVWGLSGYPLAMVYAPLQNFSGLYEPEKGLCRGTIFPALDLPLLSVGNKGGGMARNG